MKWFKHDSDAGNDAKLRKLRLKYGAQGYGIYWYCLELIARNVEKHNLTFELEHDAILIGDDFKLSGELVQEMMSYMVDLGLFENSHGVITCLKMSTRTDEYTQQLMRDMKKTPEKLQRISGHTPESVTTISEVKEEKRKEQNINIIANRKTTISDDFSPSEANIKFAQDNNLNLSHEIDQFKNHALAHGLKYIDWQAALRTWLGNAKRWNKPSSDKQQPFVMRSI